MEKTRIRCPACGTRLNEGVFDRELELGDGKDVIIQEIGGRGNISTISSNDFEDDETTELVYDRIEAAYEYLADILGMEDEEDDESDEEDDEAE